MRLGTMHSSMSAPLSEPSAAMYSYLVYWIIKKKRIWEKKHQRQERLGSNRKRTQQYSKTATRMRYNYYKSINLVDELLVPEDDRVDEGRRHSAQERNVLPSIRAPTDQHKIIRTAAKDAT